jgi:hypothetical protein
MGVYQRRRAFALPQKIGLVIRVATIYTSAIRRGPSGLERRPSEVHLQRKPE